MASPSPLSIAAVLLAAGRSTRFGSDKLRADCGGQPVLTRAARALRDAAPGPCLAVLRDAAQADLLPNGYQIALCQDQQSDSLRMAVRWAASAPGLLIALADMPFVTPDLHRAVMAAMTTLPACARAASPLPPAVFPAAWFPRLQRLTGDRGAGALLRDLPARQYVTAPAHQLRDIDRPSDLP
ncbi:nucleotidyltransferase family protein [Paracoccus sp. S1E-3]|uniref:nucleotidyltransferase family protein n=1 Tax=Paracoccus sp. S1E-3 TaxID=2756130 RepID=UPI0015EEB870|nr:nucleotidyltransferase family protein [Paracoccus sp. S1E-3]MBA4489939.1 nucleotidyltransferase family protein [Paracoccus sp. S1E-3]